MIFFDLKINKKNQPCYPKCKVEAKHGK